MTRKDAIILSVIYILGVIWIITYREYGWDITICPIKLMFGIPCPACGTTRAIELAFDGRIIDSILMNPNIIFTASIAIGAPIILAAKLLLNRDYMKKIDRWLCKKSIIISFTIIELSIWVYNIARHV